MNKKTALVAVVVVLLVIGGVATFVTTHDTGRIPAIDYKMVYRLVPEKMSRSAAIRIEVPSTVETQLVDISKQVTFVPPISGHWLKEGEVMGAAAYDASVKDKVFYYKPDGQLDIGVRHDVVLAISGNQPLRADFLTVGDPEITAILPHGDDEVMPNTKISIVFNRPMVPLGVLEQFTSEQIPVTITPKAPGKYKWISTNTLQFIPDGGLVSSANYKVKVNSGLRSLEGLDIKPAESSFSTLHMRFWSEDPDSFGNYSKTSAVRGYNQPLLIRFNQAVDLDKTKSFVKVIDSSTGGNSTQFVLKYGSTPTDKGIKDDETIMAIYPVGGEEGSWKPEHQYTVTVDRAYPKSSGDIFTPASNSFIFTIDKIYSGLVVASSRTNQASVDRLDPTGQLGIIFYENVDLSKSHISGPYVDKVVYDEKCQEGTNPCIKIPDNKKILVSFKADRLHPGDKVEVMLDPIVTDTGVRLTSQPLPINLAVYQPLSVYEIKGDKNLDRLTICSNNPLKTDDKNNKLSAEPSFRATSWQGSYPSSIYPGSNGCGSGRFETVVYGYLLGQTKYHASLTVTDVFGGSAQGTFDFGTRSVNNGDYQLRSYQNGDVVTTPSKTKLSFAASYLPEITATVCQLSPYNFYRVRNDYKLKPRDLCSQVAQKTITLADAQPGLKEFSVDIQDYFPQAIGNYAVLLSSPLITEGSDSSWRSYATTYVSVTNLIVTEKRIDPLETNNYDSLRLTGNQISKLKNLYWVIDATTREPVSGASVNLFKNGSVVEMAVTDPKGLAFLTPVAGTEMTVVTHGNDVAVVSGYSARLNYANDAVNVKKMYIYSDKPIYRPGQEVDVKGIYRLGYDGYYELPPTEPVTLTIHDSGNDVVKEVDLVPNNFGTISTAFTLTKSARLGTYSVCVKYQCTSFDVLDYSPAAFKVTLKTGKDEYFVGDQPAVNLDAAYYFGVPVGNASVDYHVSSQYYNFDKYAKEYFNFNN
ncbi:MAG: MG2 domain-containing protein, partial [Candidatus Taylorbacteria bacterium]|nr:MG2 domain-containing protein [Candidatus Taylorbacteria bacterium]